MRDFVMRVLAAARRVRSLEPAALAEFARAVIVAAVAAGWVALDDSTVATIASAAGFALSLGLTWLVRRNVVPEAKVADTPKHRLDKFRDNNPHIDTEG